MPHATTIDLCQTDLCQLGWSIGVVAYRGRHGTVWLVYGTKDGETIAVRAARQDDAWQIAANQAHVMAE